MRRLLPFFVSLRSGVVPLTFALAIGAGCEGTPVPPLELSHGVYKRTFRPVSALAEYLETPEHSRVLRLIFTSYPATCDAPLPVPEQQVAVIVTITTPFSTPLVTGDFHWEGHERHGGTPQRPEQPYAFLRAVTESRALDFGPGGGVRLEHLGGARGEIVSGVFTFLSAAAGRTPASSFKGSFRARLCSFTPFVRR